MEGLEERMKGLEEKRGWKDWKKERTEELEQTSNVKALLPKNTTKTHQSHCSRSTMIFV